MPVDLDAIWAVLPGALLIFAMRVTDVSMGTVRQITSVQGRATLAALIGFVETTIFVLAIAKVITSISDSPLYVFGYSGGFAVGTFVGIHVERVIGLGTRLVRVITSFQNDGLVAELRRAGFGVTFVPGQGKEGKVYILFSVVRRRAIPSYLAIVTEYAPNAFYAIEETRQHHGGLLGGSKRK